MLFNFFADRYVARASIAFAMSTVGFASAGVHAQAADAGTTTSASINRRAGSSRDDAYQRLRAAVKERCRPLSNRWIAPFSAGPGNGRATATRPAQPSLREQCIRQGLRDGRTQRDGVVAREATVSAPTGTP